MDRVRGDMSAAIADGGGSIRRLARQVGWARIAVTILFLVIALLFARFGWSIPLAVDAERALYDVRALVTAPQVEQDPRIVMVVYTDRTLELTGKRSPLDRALLAKALTNIDRLGAKAIGIDILIDQPQPEDPELIRAFRGMRTPTYLGFASNATNANFMQVWQEEFLASFLKQLKPGNVRPTSIRLEADPDNVARSWPTQPAVLPPLLPNAVAGDTRFRDYQGGIRYRLPADPERPVFNSLSIELFENPALADAMRDQIQGRYVLIGGDIADIDQFETPATRLTNQTTTGLEVHATLLAQLLDAKRLVVTPYWLVWLAALLVIACAAGTALLDVKPIVAGLLFVLQLALIAALPFWLRSLGVDTQRVPAFGWAVGWIVAFSAVSAAARAVTSDQRRFAQSALGKYLPVDIANELLRNPDRLALHGEKREIYALFSDLEGFTKLSHAIEPEMVAFLLNSYLDRLSAVVLEHGGTIDKFVGDAVVAFWGAPISRPDDADRAAKAAIAMYQAGEVFRTSAPPGVPPIGVTRVGVHRGEAIVGNFGGEGRMQYTALGDSMNLAARLEGANKQLKTKVLLSDTARARSTLTLFRPMGRVAVRGRSTPIAVWEPVPQMSAADVTAFTDMVNAFDQGDPQALQRLEEYAGDHPDDAGVANLVYRLKQVGSGGSFVLD
ncbi:adenylate/guanylate cyclase domain-containing protein [Sphingomonas sp. 1P06PA]|uniref:CHASE2 domain-containing protein n=1 Tax=Sphingomonas sp. 1P06PA TaxID=554121 RepID=UPI0039A74C33